MIILVLAFALFFIYKVNSIYKEQNDFEERAISEYNSECNLYEYIKNIAYTGSEFTKYDYDRIYNHVKTYSYNHNIENFEIIKESKIALNERRVTNTLLSLLSPRESAYC